MTSYKDAEYEHHESMGMIGVYRISGHNDCMHGTDVPHDGWLKLTVYKGSVKRDLNREWHHAEDEYIEVELTHSQFSEMISNMNCGYGVPCTVKYLMGKRMESPKPIDRKGQFSEEFAHDLAKIASKLNGLKEIVTESMKTQGMSKKEKQSLLSLVNSVKQDITSNLPFVERQFGECISKAVDDAKRNIEGHALNIALNASRRGLVTVEEGSKLEQLGVNTLRQIE